MFNFSFRNNHLGKIQEMFWYDKNDKKINNEKIEKKYKKIFLKFFKIKKKLIKKSELFKNLDKKL